MNKPFLPRQFFTVPITAPVLYDGYEIATVGEYDQHDGTTACEPLDSEDDDPCDNDDLVNVFYTVYGHLPKGGVQAIADLNDERAAVALFNHLCKMMAAFAESKAE